MSDWNCQVVKIQKLVKHPNADTLSIATVMHDYPVVVKNGLYEAGQLVAYVAIDSIVPDTQQFHFLCSTIKEKYEENGEIKERTVPKYPVGSVPEKYRIIKAKKIRDIYSMGMIVPAPLGLNEGDSIVEAFGLTKWEEVEEEAALQQTSKPKKGETEKAPKGWKIPYYDIEGFRKYGNCLIPGEEIVLNEKIHGCLHYDTLVDTLEFGSKRIGDLVEQKIFAHVKSMDIFTGEVQYQKIEAHHMNGDSNDWYEIETECERKVKITGNHFVWLPEHKCYRKVEDLSEKDLLEVDF